MKTRSIVSYCLFLALLFVGMATAQEMKPDAAKLYNAGNKFLKEGNYDAALSKYNDALKIEKDFRIYYQRGVAFKATGKLDSAKASFEACSKQKPDFEAAYNALGGVYFAMGKYQEAADNFEKVLAAVKNNSVKDKIKSNLAFVYAKMGSEASNDQDVQKAIKDYKRATELSNYDAAFLGLAKAYSASGEYDKSLEAAQNALKYRSTIGKGGPYYYMGVAYKNLKETDKAKEMLDKAKTDPTYKKLAEYELAALQ